MYFAGHSLWWLSSLYSCKTCQGLFSQSCVHRRIEPGPFLIESVKMRLIRLVGRGTKGTKKKRQTTSVRKLCFETMLCAFNPREFKLCDIVDNIGPKKSCVLSLFPFYLNEFWRENDVKLTASFYFHFLTRLMHDFETT